MEGPDQRNRLQTSAAMASLLNSNQGRHHCHSHPFGIGKPEPRVYEFLMDLFGVGAHETWMVGDNLEWEVAAPQRLGILSIWCNPLGAPLPAGKGIRPDHVIGGVPELLALL